MSRPHVGNWRVKSVTMVTTLTTSIKPGTSVAGSVSQPCRVTSSPASVVRPSPSIHHVAPRHAAVPPSGPSAAVQHLPQVHGPETIIPDHVSDVRRSLLLTQRLSCWPHAVVERCPSTAVSPAEDVSVPGLAAESVMTKYMIISGGRKGE